MINFSCNFYCICESKLCLLASTGHWLPKKWFFWESPLVCWRWWLMGIITLQWCGQNENATASVYTGSLQAHKLAALYVHWHLGGTLCRSLWPTTTLQCNSAICLWIWRTRRMAQIQGTQSKRAHFEAPLRHRCNIWSVSHRAQPQSRVPQMLTVFQMHEIAFYVVVVLLSTTVIYY